MRALVIGGTQFMGRFLVERLLARGDEVSVLHRRSTHELGPAVTNLQADRADLETVAALTSRGRYEAIFDLAYDWDHGTPASQVEAVARHAGDRVHRYVFMSSAAAYGPGLDHEESDALVPDDPPGTYAQDKASAERLLFGLHATSGFPVVTIRPPYVHGPHQPFYREQFFWDRLRDGRAIILPAGGGAPMQWAYAADVATACVRALETPEACGQAFNVAHVERTTQRTFVEALARVAGVSPRLVPISREAIAAAGDGLYFGESLDMEPHTLAVDKARRILALSPTPLEAALREGYAWYLAQPRRPGESAFEDRLLAAQLHAT